MAIELMLYSWREDIYSGYRYYSSDSSVTAPLRICETLGRLSHPLIHRMSYVTRRSSAHPVRYKTVIVGGPSYLVVILQYLLYLKLPQTVTGSFSHTRIKLAICTVEYKYARSLTDRHAYIQYNTKHTAHTVTTVCVYSSFR